VDLNGGEDGEEKIWRKSDGQIHFITFVVEFFSEIDSVMSST